MADVQHLLTVARLVTLAGAGGCGKTRLAHAVALDVTLQSDGKIGWVELAHINDPTFVPQTVAKALQINEQPSLSMVEVLQETLATQQLLLVLDNCEHLLAACADLVQALLQSTAIQIIVTSREPLGIIGERLYPVPPLTLPTVQQSVSEIAQSEAVQIFVERACHIHPFFALTSENAKTVAAICRQLEGMPLAIELAAVRVNVLSVDQIRQRLTQPLDLLVGAPSTEQRHRTLRYAIDWSYDLLSPHERLLLQRLSLFPASFTLATVEAACAWGEMDRSRVLELLTSLINKSLVVVETIQAQEARYRILETIRQYASEKLAVSGEQTAVSNHYLNTFLTFAEEIAPKLHGPEQHHWMQWLEREHDNLRMALALSLANGHIETGLRLAFSLTRFWEIRAYVREGLTWFDRLFARADENIPLAVRVNALTFATFLAHFLGEATATQAYAHTAHRLVQAAGEEGQPLLYIALSALSSSYEIIGDFGASFAIHEQVLQLLQQAHATPFARHAQQWAFDAALTLGMTVLVQGNTATELGDYATAHHYLTQSLTLAQRDDDPYRLAMTYLFLGNLAYCEHAYRRSQLYYEQSMTLMQQLGATRDLAAPLQNLGHTCLQLGEVARAHALFGESLTIHQAEQNRQGMAECLLGFASLAIQQGLFAEGVRLLAVVERIGWRSAKSSWTITSRLIDHAFNRARSALTESAFHAEQLVGQSLALTQAIAYAQHLPLTTPMAPPLPKNPDTLSEREREVVVLIALGKSNGEIAEQLVLSKRTVEKHIANIFAKFGLSNRAQMVRWALAQGLADAET